MLKISGFAGKSAIALWADFTHSVLRTEIETNKIKSVKIHSVEFDAICEISREATQQIRTLSYGCWAEPKHRMVIMILHPAFRLRSMTGAIRLLSGAEAPKHQPIFHDSFLHSAFRSAVLLLKHDFYVM